MGLTAATAAWLVPSLVAAAGVGTSAIQAHQQARAQQAQAEEAKQAAQKQAQVQAEQAPEQAVSAGNTEAVKKRKASFGIQESILNNMSSNTVGQKETWG